MLLSRLHGWVFEVAVAVALGASSLHVRAEAQCAAAGEPVQWVADYCMLKMQTDDEIAVSGCIDLETRKGFPSRCASNLHFKRKMCDLAVRNGTRAGTVAHCVSDPAFKGSVVAAGGVGR
jgi:hypothetical protein